MTTDTTYKPLKEYLKQLHTYAQNIETTIRQAIDETAQVGREAEAAALDFESFVESWCAMLPVAHNLADACGIDSSVFASSWTDLLLTIRARVASNEELREMMETSLSNKVANAGLIGQNIEWLLEVTPQWIANYMSTIRSEQIMDNAIAELASRGEPATDRLKWLSKSLKKHGY